VSDASASDPYTLAGDFDGDAVADIARFVGYAPADTGLWVLLSDGQRFHLTSAYRSGVDVWERTHAQPFVADVDGDGTDEICAFYDQGQANTALWVFKWNGSGFTPSKRWESGVGNWTWPWAKPVAGDVDGDGMDEICAFYDYGQYTAIWVFKWNGSGFTPTEGWRSGVGGWTWSLGNAVAADIDGDGADEICTFYDYGRSTTGLWVFKWNGSGFAPTEAARSAVGGWDWASTKPLAADLNGDGTDEVCTFYDYGESTTGLYVFLWDQSGVLLGRAWESAVGAWEWSRTRPVAADADGDGGDEVFSLYGDGDGESTLFCLRPEYSWVPFAIWSKAEGEWSGATLPLTTDRFVPLHTSITIRANAATTYIGRTVTLSGAVTPLGMIGRNIVAYVMKPGKRYWTYSSNRTTYSLAGKAAWLYKYYFKRGMAKGVYKFKAVVPPWPGFLTSTSPTIVSIRLR
jgi:hypothetical protein